MTLPPAINSFPGEDEDPMSDPTDPSDWIDQHLDVAGFDLLDYLYFEESESEESENEPEFAADLLLDNTLQWVPGHCDVQGNEKADALTKQAGADGRVASARYHRFREQEQSGVVPPISSEGINVVTTAQDDSYRGFMLS
ncbi:hypothetical protein CDAR_36751 [Caerostris darwini]|uniref:RNase H type-1 domain-containing protein n=1 Tax=Caerostris darwini TaxID=1538125 RepID=A0AAV4UVL7_9ARAC|nr:hypothetical protein CDAR_36751 [Caerostris darwini]